MTSLTSHQMLTLEEERDLVQSLASQTRTELSQLVTYLYSGSLKKYSEVKLTSLPSLGLVTSDTEKWSEMLGDNSDVRVSELCISSFSVSISLILYLMISSTLSMS